MPDAPMPLPPGSMTVPVWFGWESVAAVVTLLLVAALVFLLVSASRSGGAARRDEWQALLEARSARAGALLDDEPATARQPGEIASR